MDPRVEARRSLATRWRARRPSWVAAGLALVNLQRRASWLAPVTLVGIALLSIPLSQSGAAQVTAGAARHPVIVTALATLLAAAVALRSRQVLHRKRVGFWLGAVPNDASSLERQVAAVLISPAGLALALVFPVLVGRARIVEGLELLGYWVLGSGIGLLIGRTLPSFARATTPGSWYVLMRKVRASSVQASLLPLGYWPVARNQVWGRPKVTSRRALIVLLMLPLDISGAAAVAVTAGLLIAVNMITLLLAVIRVAFSASLWLAPTPVSARRFAFAVVHLAVGKQLVLGVLLVCAAWVIGGSSTVAPAMLILGSWMAFFTGLAAVASGYAFRPDTIAASKFHRWLS